MGWPAVEQYLAAARATLYDGGWDGWMRWMWEGREGEGTGDWLRGIRPSLTLTPSPSTADGRPVPGAAASLPPLPLTAIGEVTALVQASVPTILYCHNQPGLHPTGKGLPSLSRIDE